LNNYKEWVLGIDPGVHGALSLIEPVSRTIINIWDMPNYSEVLTTGKKRVSIDVDKLGEIFKTMGFAAAGDDVQIRVQIEKVQAYGKQSAPAAFNFGYAAAIPYIYCKILEWPVTFISAVSWKKQFGITATKKDAARLLVIQYFPNHRDYFTRKMDVDRADATLIAMYRGAK